MVVNYKVVETINR